MSVPTINGTLAAARPMTRSYRVPQMTRAKISRPSSSVPQMCSAEGAASMAVRFWSVGDWLAMSPGNSAVNTTQSRIKHPAVSERLRRSTFHTVRRCVAFTASACICAPPLLQLDAGVKHGIQNIGEQVHRHDDNGKQDNAALYGGVIPRQDAGHDQ